MNDFTNNVNPFIQILQSCIDFISNKKLFLSLEVLSFLVVGCIGFIFIRKYYEKHELIYKRNHTFYLLSTIIFCMLFENFAWILKLSYQLGYISIYKIVMGHIVTIAWILSVIMYQCLGLFIENLVKKDLTLNLHQKIFLAVTTIFMTLFIPISIAHLQGYQVSISLLDNLMRFAALYRNFMLLPAFNIAFNAIYYSDIPELLKHQLSTFLKYIIFPLLITDMIHYIPILQTGAYGPLSDFVGTVSISLIITMIIFATVKLLRFRFFNFSPQVDGLYKGSTMYVIDDAFTDALFSMSKIDNTKDLLVHAQEFLGDNFLVSKTEMCIMLRYNQELCTAYPDQNDRDMFATIETFINSEPEIVNLMRKYNVVVNDEITFDAYYSDHPEMIKLAQFMDSIDCEIFLPMFGRDKKLIAYLTIKKRMIHSFYTASQQYKLTLYGVNLATVVAILHAKTIQPDLSENQALRDELHLKTKEAEQNRETLKQLLRQKSSTGLGLIFYKNNRFSYGNQIAEDLLGVDLNNQQKHPTTVALLKMAQLVEDFRIEQTRFIKDVANNQIMVTGVPDSEYNNGAVILVHYPDASDILKAQLDKLKNHTHIDYLLYLETTKAGKMINDLIPSNSEILLDFKIKLLKTALDAKATLLQSHQDDLMSIVKIIHYSSLRTMLNVLELQPGIVYHDLSIKLFGVNAMIVQPQAEEGILKRLDQIGTLFIKNVECMDLETQRKLAQYIRLGLYTITKSEKQVFSDVRIICSVGSDPETLIKDNKLAPELYKEMSSTALQMPSLLTISDEEVQELMEGFTSQGIEASHSLAHILQISRKEKEMMLTIRPASLVAFKAKVQQLLQDKTNEYHIFDQARHETDYTPMNPKLLEAARMGKEALKDVEIMTMLWEEFHCQNRIAQFLGVNRSSVHRRCKEYNLEN